MIRNLFLFVSVLFVLSSCIALFDSSNFGDGKKLKKIMLDETWNINTMSIYDGERNSRNEPFTTIRDTIIATSGTMFFEKESELGVRKFVYTNPEGQILEASFTIETDVNDDNPFIKFIDFDAAFPEPYQEAAYKVISFDDTKIELLKEFYGTGDLTLQETSIIITK